MAGPVMNQSPIPAPQTLQSLLPAVIDIAQAAGDAIMTVYARDFAVQTKADASPLTEADLAAQALINARLTALRPDIPIIGEESLPASTTERLGWPTLWLVDPLDGTREFVARNGEFTVNIALVHQHEPVLGVMLAPALQRLYAGIPGIGAWRSDARGALQPIRAQASSAAAARVLVSRSHRGNSVDTLLARLGAHELVPIGSALKFGLLAEGAGDLYARPSPTSEWDTAAGHAIAVAAGAQVVQPDGSPLRYNTREGFLNPGFLAYADAQRDWRALCGAEPAQS
ncbi:MAG: 3'(2'),5'-bisphosphate nucleotidase CysQ [Steroidobacteraceae bacterium]